MNTHQSELNLLEAQLMAEITNGLDFFYNTEMSQAVITQDDESFIKLPMTSWLIEQGGYCARLLNNNLDIAHMDSRVGWNETDDYTI